MRLSRRLLLGALALVSVLTLTLLAITNRRLDQRLTTQVSRQLAREARVIAGQWRSIESADSLADHWGSALERRVTLIAPDGRVLGDSEFEGEAMLRLESHADRPEFSAALGGVETVVRRRSRSTNTDQIYAAAPAAPGVARVSVPMEQLEAVHGGAASDLLVAGVIALIVTTLVALLFSRAISRPIVELRDVARGFAAGDLSRRPPLHAPGEIGDLATALYRMADQLGTRLAAMERDEALMHALIESLHEGVVAVDARGQVVRLNESARRLLDIRSPVPFPADQLPREQTLREALSAALNGEATQSGEVRAAGRTLALTALPLQDGGAVIALYDMTPVRRLEMIRRDFVANVSHELRTPLTVIGGFADTLVIDDPPPEARRQFLETIRANAYRMQRIVDDLLDLSRIESGRWSPQPTRIDVAPIAREVLDGVRDTAAARGVKLDSDLAEDAGIVTADPTALRQVLTNLVENAVRYTPAGGSVSVFTERDASGTWVGVRDTGIGMTAEHLPRIFERFYRVDPARSRDVGGTGLGLAIVRHLTEAHGGHVRAESTVGKGTTIAALFPSQPPTPGVEGTSGG